MTLVLLGQLLGVSFACGLNLYLTVAALGLLSRFGLIDGLPTGLQGLEGAIVIASALGLYLVEAVVDKVPHADSLWDTVHTFIRPPAAALLAVGALWGLPLYTWLGGAAFAFVVALAAHATKAGLRLAINAAPSRKGQTWISFGEDVAAVAFAVAALQYPTIALIAGAIVLLLVAVVGPRLWRAFALGMRCLAALIRGFLGPPRWRDLHEIPGSLRSLLDEQPLGTAPPRGTRAAIYGVRGVGAYRNGWLVVTVRGPVFLYRTVLGKRRVDLPPSDDVTIDRGAWANTIRVASDEFDYTLYLLKDGPAVELAIADLQTVPA